MAARDFKDQGNVEFKAGNWLKAAALYSKGLKEDPENHVLLSNRSAALLKLNKVQKALADAEECIKCKPAWEKGYFRKANVLEATQKFDQALEAYQEAAKRNEDSKEVANKVKMLTRLVRNSAAQNGQSHTKSSNGAINSQKDYDSAKSGLGKGDLIPSSKERIESFGQQILELVEDEIQRRTFDRSFPSVFFLPDDLDIYYMVHNNHQNPKWPFEWIKNDVGLSTYWQPHGSAFWGRESPGGTAEKMGQVSIQAAFDSPETLTSALHFLRQYGADSESQAAVAVVPKHKIAYPQVWQKPMWPLGKATDGIFVQLEAPGIRKIWFLPLGQKNRDAIPLKDKFALLEALFR